MDTGEKKKRNIQDAIVKRYKGYAASADEEQRRD